MTLKVDILLTCGHLNTVEIDSVLEKPKVDDIQECIYCRRSKVVMRVGTPYKPEHDNRPVNDNQQQIGGS